MFAGLKMLLETARPSRRIVGIKEIPVEGIYIQVLMC